MLFIHGSMDQQWQTGNPCHPYMSFFRQNEMPGERSFASCTRGKTSRHLCNKSDLTFFSGKERYMKRSNLDPNKRGQFAPRRALRKGTADGHSSTNTTSRDRLGRLMLEPKVARLPEKARERERIKAKEKGSSNGLVAGLPPILRELHSVEITILLVAVRDSVADRTTAQS